MTKMAGMPIYGKYHSQIISGTAELIATKLNTLQLVLKNYNVFINHDPVMTLIDSMAGSTVVTYAEIC